MTANPFHLSIPFLGGPDGPNMTVAISKPKTPSRRMTLERTTGSSPITPITPISPGSQTTRFQDAKIQNQSRPVLQDLLTPPRSPIQPGHSGLASSPTPSKPALSFILPHHQQEKPSIDRFVLGSISASITPPEEGPLLEYPYELEHVHDDTGKNVEFGSGAWSTVYKCISRSGSSHSEDGRKSLPASVKSLSPLVVAVKTPHRKDGQAILRSEARILSHLSRLRRAEDRVVPFHGCILESNSLVMSAIPLSLADHISSCNIEMRSMYKRSARGTPVVGSETIWLSLATKLIDSLHWLHDMAGVVHGDIKPHNILLRSVDPEYDCDSSYQLSSASSFSFPYTPLLVDFSSSHLTNSLTRSPGALSALTPQYTAPELLSSKVLRDPNTLPTTRADVFSLAVTLLVCTTGDLNVYPAPSLMQRQAMAQQGWSVIEFARNGDGGLRVPRGGVVERVLERAVMKVGMGRCNAREWKGIVRDRAREMKEGPTEMG